MGSLNHYPVSEKDPGKNQQQDIQQELNAEEKLVISMLINSVLYFIECVFIIRTKDKFRLVALHHGRVLFDRYYPTERGCKIAFHKLFKEKAWNEEVNADWSHFYGPDKLWLEEKMSPL